MIMDIKLFLVYVYHQIKYHTTETVKKILYMIYFILIIFENKYIHVKIIETNILKNSSYQRKIIHENCFYVFIFKKWFFLCNKRTTLANKHIINFCQKLVYVKWV